MLIDWFTVCAQALNFLILVWLMKRFLYKPILNAIDAREKLVAKELSDADAKKREAKSERDEFQQKNDEFDKHRSGLLSKAVDDANIEQARLLDEAREAADELSAKRRTGLLSDARHLNQAIRRRAQQEVFAIARKVLTDLASASLEEQMAEVFIRRLKGMDDKSKDSLAEALKTSSEPALVRSAFKLPAKQRTAIQDAMHETLSPKVQIRFETSLELVGGIEIVTNGLKVGWSISDYLESLESGVGELLKKADPDPKPKQATAPVTEHPARAKPKAARVKPTARSL